MLEIRRSTVPPTLEFRQIEKGQMGIVKVGVRLLVLASGHACACEG